LELLVDIGNTSLKWAPFESGRLGEMRSVRHLDAIPIDLHAAWEQLPAPGRVLAASVAARSVSDSLQRACRCHWGLGAHLVQTEPVRRGVAIAYQDPARLGVDRWLALIAAHEFSQAPALVVDAGTAVTYDLLLPTGRHLGGLILPGVRMMRDGLLANTQIPRVEPEEPDGVWTTDTATAVAAGSVQAPAALAERLMHRLAQVAGSEPVLFLTGGDAELLRPAIAAPARLEPDLVLQGLALLLD
jgi:type III pantothenate kinase